MILKDYINFEKKIHHRLITINNKEVEDPEKDTFPIENNQNLSLLINLGNTIKVNTHNEELLFPPKNAYLVKNKSTTFFISKGKVSKYTVISFHGKLENCLLKEIKNAVSFEFAPLFQSERYIFDFPLNIDILMQIENLYKIDFKNKQEQFLAFEIKSRSYALLLEILKRLFIERNTVCLPQIATNDTKYCSQINSLHEKKELEKNNLSNYFINKN